MSSVQGWWRWSPPSPDPYGEGVQPAVKHRVGAIVGLLQGRTQTREAGRRPNRSSLGCCWSVLFLPGRKNAGVSMILENFLTICDCSFHHRSGLSGCQRLPFLSWRAVAWSKTWIGTDYWWDLLSEGGVALACPWEWWPWCRPFPGADATIPNRISTCYYKIAPTKQLWDHQNGDHILSRHRQCPKCPRELVWTS